METSSYGQYPNGPLPVVPKVSARMTVFEREFAAQPCGIPNRGAVTTRMDFQCLGDNLASSPPQPHPPQRPIRL